MFSSAEGSCSSNSVLYLQEYSSIHMWKESKVIQYILCPPYYNIYYTIFKIQVLIGDMVSTLAMHKANFENIVI